MSVDVNKLIADAKARQLEAQKNAELERKVAAKDKTQSQAAAESKAKADYAESLKSSLRDYEARLKIFATKIARGDKLDVLEQKEFDKLVKDYNSLDKTINKALKESYDIVVNARREAGNKAVEEFTGKSSANTVVEGPMGAKITPTKKTPPVKTPIQKGAEALGKFPDKTWGAGVELTFTPGQTKPPFPGANKFPAPSTTPAGPGIKTPPKTIDDVIKDAAGLGYGAIDTVFKTVPELTSLLTKAVTEKWTPARFQSELQNSVWFKSNATDLQQRGFYKRQYNDLVNGIAANDPDRQAKIDALAGSTDYGRGLASVKRLIQAEAIAEGAVIDTAALDTLAQDIYDHALEKDGLAIRQYVRAQIKYNPGKILSGKAGTDLADLKKTAAANGIDLDKAFGTSIQGWLQKLAAGESVETYKTIIRQAAKMGLPDKVASLLDNGVDLQTIYNPYRNLMANTLEINPETIKLDDPTLRSAITPTGEQSLYDFAKQLRQDNRWQYTQQARGEVSNAVQQVLKDFGFMG